MADKAHRLTDKELERMERHLSAIYSQTEKNIKKSFNKFIDGIKKESAKLIDEIKKAETQQDRQNAKAKYALFFKKVVKSKEFNEITSAAADALYDANKEANNQANKIAPYIYALNYNYIGKGIDRSISGYDFSEITEEEAQKYGEITKESLDKKKDTEWNRKNIEKSVLVGALLMLDAKKTIDRAVKATVNRNLSAAKMQSSGIVSDAENKGRFDSIARANDEGFGVKKVWKATLDNRTRDSHIALDGVSIPINERFGNGLQKPRDPDGSLAEICNCRCRLGYDVGQAKSENRAARSGDVSGSYKKSSSFKNTETETVKNMTYKEWMEWRKK